MAGVRFPASCLVRRGQPFGSRLIDGLQLLFSPMLRFAKSSGQKRCRLIEDVSPVQNLSRVSPFNFELRLSFLAAKNLAGISGVLIVSSRNVIMYHK